MSFTIMTAILSPHFLGRLSSFAESPCSSSFVSLYSVAKDICKLPVEPGPCQIYMTRYFYNSAAKKCEMFRYGGCQGNENRFATKDECLKTCGQLNKLRFSNLPS
uniref:BPTI/Kunitz inhibitor domain-containing protein n=1 Tax=Chelonoidis abingdonii TaxID=106734 RepID=A0A8C0GMP0_CHEAB